MDLERLTRKSQDALQRAGVIARDRHHPDVAPAHVLAALLEDADGTVMRLVQRLGARARSLSLLASRWASTRHAESVRHQRGSYGRWRRRRRVGRRG